MSSIIAAIAQFLIESGIGYHALSNRSIRLYPGLVITEAFTPAVVTLTHLNHQNKIMDYCFDMNDPDSLDRLLQKIREIRK